MSDPDTENLVKLAERAANEGIPIAAIGRILTCSFDDVHEWLSYALSLGKIGQMPRPEWPPAVKWSDRIPGVPRSLNLDDASIHLTRIFHLTPLENAFLVSLLQHNFVTRDGLHGIAKYQRSIRATRPEDPDDIEPKIVDVIVCKLRKKLYTVDPEALLQTVHTKGYYFEPKVKQRIFDRVAKVLSDEGYGERPKAK